MTAQTATHGDIFNQNQVPTILGIESSCDETGCAITKGTVVCASAVASQVKTHAEFGGVVPELASREHLNSISPCIEQAMSDAEMDFSQIDAIAVTEGPGLIGALLIGVQAGRALGATLNKPVYGVHHLEGHVYSIYLQTPGDRTQLITEQESLQPHLCLLVSGGHSMLIDVRGPGQYHILGSSRDDAVGEAFDKAAKMLGLGYPGGPIVDRLAQHGQSDRYEFPRAMLAPKNNLEFSFSGLKTALYLHLQREGQPKSKAELQDLCASYQAAIVDVLMVKCERALQKTGHRRLHLVGGVAANSALRLRMQQLGQALNIEVRAAALRYCGDNAAMIAAAAQRQVMANQTPAVDVHTNRSIETLAGA